MKSGRYVEGKFSDREMIYGRGKNVRVICKQCKKEFEMTDEEIKFYVDKNLNTPKRCKACRELNKLKKTNQKNTKQSVSTGLHLKEKISSDRTVSEQGKLSPGQQTSGSPYVKNPVGKNMHNYRKYNRLIPLGIMIFFLLICCLIYGISEFTSEPVEDSYQTYGISEFSSEPVEDSDQSVASDENNNCAYTFRSEENLEEHYQKHGIYMGYNSAQEYLDGANSVIANSGALTKLEKEDGDYVYFLQETNDFVVVSTEGYIRTYFRPDDGIDYYNRQ